MTVIKAIILGIIQGISEPLPISSSAQTKVASYLMGIETPGILFEVYLNFASFLAILWIMRDEVLKIIRESILYLFNKQYQYYHSLKIANLIIIGTIPAAFFGFLMKDFIDNYFTIRSMGICFMITGLILFLAREMYGKKNENRMTWKDALFVGLVQGTLTLIPGISRLGATFVAGLTSGLNRETAFHYSFLLYLPISLGTMLFGSRTLMTAPFFQENTFEHMIMCIVTFLSTFVGYRLLKITMEKGKLIYFSFYCWIAGIGMAVYIS